MELFYKLPVRGNGNLVLVKQEHFESCPFFTMSEQLKKAELLERKLNATKRKLSALQAFPLDKLHVQPDNELYQRSLVDPLVHYELEILKKRNNEL